MLRDAPHQQRIFNPSKLCIILNITQHLMPMPPIQKNHRRSSIESSGSTRRSSFTFLGRGRRGCSCDVECSSRIANFVRTEGLYHEKNVGITFFAAWYLTVVNLIDTEEQIIFTIMCDIKFWHPQRLAFCLQGSSVGTLLLPE